MSRKLKALVIAVACLLLSCCFFACAGAEKPVVTLSQTSIVLNEGEKATVTVTSTKGGEAVWTTDNGEVLMVKNGVITAIAEGTAKVTATVDGVSATLTVVVRPAEKFIVSFDGKTQDVYAGKTATKPHPNPIKAADERNTYEFDAWYVKGTDTAWDFNNPITENLVLESRFTATPIEYNIVADGVVVGSAKYGEYVARLASPVKEADAQYTYTFDKWVIAGTDTEWVFTKNTVTGSVELESKFIANVRTYTVKVGSTVSYVKYGETVEAPADPVKEADAEYTYAFDKWVIAGTNTAWNFDTDTVSGDLTLEAVFTSSEREYAIVLDPANGENATTTTAKYGDTIAKPADPVKASTVSSQYKFIGWYVAGTNVVWDFETELNDDVTLVAKYVESIREYTVTLVNGNDKSETVVKYGAFVSLPNLTKEDEENVYIFNGWYDGEEKFNAILTPVTGDLTLTASWTAQPKFYTVGFYKEDGALIKEVNVRGGATVAAPESAPVKHQTVSTVYSFNAWMTSEGEAFDFSAGILSDVRLYANYTSAVRQYDVTLMDGDKVFTTVKVDYNTNFSYDANADIPEYSTAGQYFVAWGEDGATEGYTGLVLGNMTLYAITAIDTATYTVTFKVEGSDDVIYTDVYRNDEVAYGSEVVAPATANALATKNVFVGWQVEGLDTVYGVDDVIRCPENGITLVAIFEEQDIIYDVEVVLATEEYTLVNENGEALTSADLNKKYGEILKFKVVKNSEETYGETTVKVGSATLPATEDVYTITVNGNKSVTISGLAIRKYSISGSVTPVKQSSLDWAKFFNSVDEVVVLVSKDGAEAVAYDVIDADGNYTVEDLKAGKYDVKFAVANADGAYTVISNDVYEFALDYTLDGADVDADSAEGKISLTNDAETYVGYLPFDFITKEGSVWKIFAPGENPAVLRGEHEKPSSGNVLLAVNDVNIGSNDFVATTVYDQNASDAELIKSVDTEPSVGLAFDNGETRLGIMFFNYGAIRIFVSDNPNKGIHWAGVGVGDKYVDIRAGFLVGAGSLLGKYGDCYRDVTLNYARSGDWLHVFITATNGGITNAPAREDMCILSINVAEGVIYTKEPYIDRSHTQLTGKTYVIDSSYNQATSGEQFVIDNEGEVVSNAIKEIFANVTGIQMYHGTGSYTCANLYGWNYTTDADVVEYYNAIGEASALAYKQTYTGNVTVNGDALANSAVNFASEGGIVTEYRTDANGNYTATVAPGKYTVTYSNAKALTRKQEITVTEDTVFENVDLDYGFYGTGFKYTKDDHSAFFGTYYTPTNGEVIVEHDEYAESSMETIAVRQDKVENHIVWGQPLASNSVWGFTMTIPEKMYYKDFEQGSAWYCDIYWKWQIGGLTPEGTVRAGFTRAGAQWGDIKAGSESIETFFKRTGTSYSTGVTAGYNWQYRYCGAEGFVVDIMYVRQGTSLAMYARYNGTEEWGLVGTETTRLPNADDVYMDIKTAGHPNYDDIAGEIIYDNFYYAEGTGAIADATASITVTDVENANVTTSTADNNQTSTVTVNAVADEGYLVAVKVNGNVVSAYADSATYALNVVGYGDYNISADVIAKEDLVALTGNVTIDFGIEYGDTATLEKTYTTASGKVVVTDARGYAYEGNVVNGVYTVYAPAGEYKVQVFSGAVTANGETVHAYRSDVATVVVEEGATKNMVVNTPTEDYYYETYFNSTKTNLGKVGRYNNGHTVMSDGSLYPIASGITETYNRGVTFTPADEIVEFGYRMYGNMSASKFHWSGAIVKSADQKRLIRIGAIYNGGNTLGFTATNPDGNASETQTVSNGNGRLWQGTISPFGYTSTVSNNFTYTAKAWTDIYFKFRIDGYKLSIYVRGTNYLPLTTDRKTDWDSTKDPNVQADGWVPYVKDLDMQAFTKDYAVFSDATYGIYHLDEECHIGIFSRFDGNWSTGNENVYRGFAIYDNVWVNVIER